MDIKQAVTDELVARGLNPYPGEYMILDKATLVTLYHTIYKACYSAGIAGGTELMKAIDNEVEARGYYVEGEQHDTQLIKTPDAPIPGQPSEEALLEQIQKLEEEVASLRSRNNDLAAVIAGYNNWKWELKKVMEAAP